MVSRISPNEDAPARRAERTKELALAALDLEGQALATLRSIPAAADVLSRSAKGRVHTLRDGRLAAALQVASADPARRRDALAAAAQLEVVEGKRWEMARLNTFVARAEARKLCGLYHRSDLTQEGLIGLLRAAQRWDPGRGVRFSTYGRWWARAAMTRLIDSIGRPVALPGGAVEDLRDLRRWVDRGVEDTAELAERMGLQEDRVRLLLQDRRPLSLEDAPPDGQPLLATLRDGGAPLDIVLETEERRHLVDAAVQELPEILQAVVLARREGLTFQDIGIQLLGGVTRERASQRWDEALYLMRRHLGLPVEECATMGCTRRVAQGFLCGLCHRAALGHQRRAAAGAVLEPPQQELVELLQEGLAESFIPM